MSGKKRRIGFSFAWNGLIEMAKTERNFQIHLIFAFLVILAGLFFHLTRMEWGMIVFVIGFVFVAEMTNSAIEKTIDYLKPDIHPAAKVIKDIAAGGVLVASIIAVIIGLIIFIPKFYALN